RNPGRFMRSQALHTGRKYLDTTARESHARAFAISHTVHFSDQILLQRCNDLHSAGFQEYVAAA
ncbi:hypothetical protein, partial [Pseudomonas amygdali]|uniref:hypothetical protein n=1 Tax=Pseudomonas amygdali TaxID=47877 RepID=UPI001C81E74C